MKPGHKKRATRIRVIKHIFRIKPLARKILVSSTLNLVFLGTGFLYISWTFQKDYLRIIHVAFPPKPAKGQDSPFKHIHYGQVAVIIDKGGLFYVHEHEDFSLKKYNQKYEEINGLTGLHADCLELLSVKELLANIRCRRENSGILDGPVISFSFTQEASFNEIIRFLDLMTQIKARRYAWTKITEEEIIALEEKKKEPIVQYVDFF